jgi:primosomal protein N''
MRSDSDTALIQKLKEEINELRHTGSIKTEVLVDKNKLIKELQETNSIHNVYIQELEETIRRLSKRVSKLISTGNT